MDQKDGSLYLDEPKRFTTTGFTTFWQAVDKTVAYCDNKIMDATVDKVLNQREQRLARNRGSDAGDHTEASTDEAKDARHRINERKGARKSLNFY